MRSYPSPKVRGGDLERQAETAQALRRGASQIQGQGLRPRRANTRLRSGAARERSYPTSKETLLRRRTRAERRYSMFKVRRGGSEKITLLQGEGKRLRFAGAAVKRHPMSKVRETQVRRQVLQEGIRGQTDKNHNHRKLANVCIRQLKFLIVMYM